MTVLPYGDRALLVELDSVEAVVALADRVRADRALADLLDDVVPGARTVLLVARPDVALDRLRAAVPPLQPADAPADAPTARHPEPPDPGAGRWVRREVEVPVTYDGPDLAEVARLTGLSEAEVVRAHTGTTWRVAFGGFAPGFAYLVGGDRRLEVPRRDSPRTSVPAGAVGLAGEFSGVYPRSSPGGWQLIGRTEVAMWDHDREPPALLGPGDRVRFVDARERR